MNENFKFSLDLNSFGFFFWNVIFGFTIVIFAIVHDGSFVPMGLLVALYGMSGHLLDLLWDRIGGGAIGQQLTGQNIYSAPRWMHVMRYLTQGTLIFFLLWVLNNKYEFITLFKD